MFDILANRIGFTKKIPCLAEEINNKKKVALSARAIDKMKPEDADKSDIGEYTGLRVICGKTGLKSFIYRYRSPIDNSLKKITLGNYPHTSLAEARIELQRLKLLRSQGICPASERKEEKLIVRQKKQESVSDMILAKIMDR